ncbi:hypothetical protein N8482_02950 [Chitinophagales bacterium]|nr:hypothetical protein [Chitinophagales bacterium]
MDGRDLPAEQLRELAIAVNETIAYEIIMNEATSEDKLSMHQSNYLEEEEIRKIYL